MEGLSEKHNTPTSINHYILPVNKYKPVSKNRQILEENQ